MNQTERIADGRRRFFAASGVVSDVLVRARKGHQDVGLERGRDYEVEPGGVSLRTIPSAGTVVIILTGEKERDYNPIIIGGPGATPAEPFTLGAKPALVNPSTPCVSASHAAADVDYSRDRPGPPATPGNYSPFKSVDAAGTHGTHGTVDLDQLKRVLFASVHETNDGHATRTAAWQDGLAMLTAMMLAAPDMPALKDATLEIESYLRG